MSGSKRKRVFILGAGCSARYGYPLGVKLVGELQSLLEEIRKISGECPFIQGAVKRSVDLASQFSEADALDKLVNLSEERFRAFRAGRGWNWMTTDDQEEKLIDKQILDAKIATAALFLHKELGSKTKKLEGYKEYLLPSIFDNSQDWQSAVNSSDCCVLSFNYDRLFEMAFLDYFGDFDSKRFPLYGKQVLNSGFDPGVPIEDKKIQVASDRFCFLKLHGSAGWWVRICASPKGQKWRHYCAMTAVVPTNIPEIEKWLAEDKQLHRLEPLIAFPHEKQLFMSEPRWDFVQTPYIRRIWEHAATVISEATEVTVIGYSFAQIDRNHLIEALLSKIPKTTRIKIENRNVEAVQCALADYQLLQDRLDFVQRTF